jgi:arylsulfatase A-like enzyme
MKGTKPNILMIVVDSGRFDRLMFHGYPRATTPHLAELSALSTDYTNANAPAGATRFSTSSIFLGQYPEAFGFSTGKLPSPDHTTLAQRLRDVGYDTFLFSSDPCVSSDTGLDRGFSHVVYIKPWSVASFRYPGQLIKHSRSVLLSRLYRNRTFKCPVEILVTAAARSIRRHRRGDAPFFVYIHLDVHVPFISDRRYLRPFLEPGITEREIRDVEIMQRQLYLYTNPTDMQSPRKERLRSVFQSMYDASWYKTDGQIHELVSSLRARSLFDSTMIVVTSDHGECLGERDLFGHGPFPYEESMHLPLIVKYPRDAAPPPGPNDRLTSTIDITPTIAELAGCPVQSDEMNGIPLLDPARRHEFVVNQRWMNRRGELDRVRRKYPHGDWDRYELGHVIALRDDQYKFVWTSKGPRYLFDMKQDPGENDNLVGHNGTPVERFEKMLANWKNQLVIHEGWDEERLRPNRRPLDE